MRLRRAIKILEKYWEGQYPPDAKLATDSLRENKHKTIELAKKVKNGEV